MRNTVKLSVVGIPNVYYRAAKQFMSHKEKVIHPFRWIVNRTLLPAATALLLVLGYSPAQAQILISSGNYNQSFDSLGTSTNWWTNNVVLPGWYASKASVDNTNYFAGFGSSFAGGIYSFGVGGFSTVADRALGSIATGATTPIACGVRFLNDTASPVTNVFVSFIGEQWRSGSVASAQTLSFSYRISSTPITNSFSGTWTPVSALNFVSPNTGGSSSALDGNDHANRQTFAHISLPGVEIQPGQELFMRWVDIDDGGNDSALALDDVSVAFGEYTPPEPLPPATNTLVLVQYNVKGNGTTDWSTNSAQVQAIARQLNHLNPDIITFNEIPSTNRWQMTNWIKTLLPGYFVATNSGDDGFICSVIASRHPITRSQSWLDWADLNPFGYTTADFTRDLFEAQISVPGFPQPLHVFTTHLKATTSGEYPDNAAKRAAEAAAITNFLATNLLAQFPLRPYLLAGDLNDTDTNALAIQRLIAPATGLRLTNPRNPVTSSINTYSTTAANPSSRLDYIMPNALLASNIRTGIVFRTDRLTPLPPNLNSNDCKVASDHLPVVMVFDNPYNKPIVFTSIERSNTTVSLTWDSVIGQPYVLQFSSNMTSWATLAANLTATSNNFVLNTNLGGETRYFRVYRNP